MKQFSVHMQGGGGSRSSMFVQSLRGDPFRVSFILLIHSFVQSSTSRTVHIHYYC